jgi:hypothetical protein
MLKTQSLYQNLSLPHLLLTMNTEECWAVRDEECVDLDLLYIFLLFSTFFLQILS